MARTTKGGPSGPTQTKAQRADAGRTRLDVWLSPDATAALDLITSALACTRRDAVEASLLAHADGLHNIGANVQRAARKRRAQSPRG